MDTGEHPFDPQASRAFCLTGMSVLALITAAVGMSGLIWLLIWAVL